MADFIVEGLGRVNQIGTDLARTNEGPSDGSAHSEIRRAPFVGLLGRRGFGGGFVRGELLLDDLPQRVVLNCAAQEAAAKSVASK